MLDQLIDQSRGYDTHKTDYGPSPVKRHWFTTDKADLIVPADLFNHGGQGVALRPTRHAFEQVCAKLGPACWPHSQRSLPANYLLACPPNKRADHLNHWIQKLSSDRRWFTRAYNDRCRAVLSDQFAVIDVTEALEWIREALLSKGNPRVEFHNTYVGPDVMHIRMIFREVERGDSGAYGVGGYFTTGEIGNKRLRACALVQRTSCLNSIIIPKDKFSYERVHRGSRMAIKRHFVVAVFEVLDGAFTALDRLLAADEREIPNFTEYIDRLCKDRGFTEVIHDHILMGTEGHESLFGVVQGLSYAAHQIKDPDERATMELYAGELLYR